MSRKLQKPWPAALPPLEGAADASPGAAVGSTLTETSLSLRVHSAPLQVWYSRYPVTVKVSCEAGTMTWRNCAVPSKYLTSMPNPSSSLTWASSTSCSPPERVKAAFSSAVNEVAIGPPLTGTVLYMYQPGSRLTVKSSSTFPSGRTEAFESTEITPWALAHRVIRPAMTAMTVLLSLIFVLL